MNKQKNNAGITLVALVITIIVLVILVGVTLSTAINTGLIDNSKTAVEKYGAKQEEEEQYIEKAAKMVDIHSMDEVQAGEYTGNSNKKYVDNNGKVAYIPAGFTVSNIEGETSIDNGLVIYSKEVTDWATAQTTHNQYVWIPVEDPSDMYGTITTDDVELNQNKGLTEGQKYSKLYSFSETGIITPYNRPSEADYIISNSDTNKKSGREPVYLNDTNYGDGSTHNNDGAGNKVITEQGIKDEFNKMINSVEIYKGFYIGRYELTGTNDNPTVVKGSAPLASLSWYELYQKCQQVEQNNNNAKMNASMIWGCQWDQALKKSVEAVKTVEDNKHYFTNILNYAVYLSNSEEQVAVSGTKNSAYNIFDMGGNVSDGTLEGNGAYARVFRGGTIYTQNKYEDRANLGLYDANGSTTCGARVQLYL